MATIEPPIRYKPEDLLKMPNGDRYELVNGQLVEKAMGWEASEIASQLFLLLGSFVRDHQLGRTVVEGSYQCFADAPDKVRKPDVSFIRRERMPADERPKGHNPIVPDLVVEVVSPHDLFSEVEVKVEEYLRAGVSLVWVVSPETRTVNIYHTPPGICRTRQRDRNRPGGRHAASIRQGFSDTILTTFAGSKRHMKALAENG